MAIREIPWQELRRAYQKGATYEELGQRYGISASTVGRRSRKENWGGRGGGTADEKRMAQRVRQLWNSVGEAMDNHAEPWGVKELKDLTALTRELMALQNMVEPQQEQREVRVVLEEELEQWSQ